MFTESETSVMQLLNTEYAEHVRNAVYTAVYGCALDTLHNDLEAEQVASALMQKLRLEMAPMKLHFEPSLSVWYARMFKSLTEA